MRGSYYITTGKVKAVNPDENLILFDIITDDPMVSYVESVEAEWKWIRPYSSAMTRGILGDKKNDMYTFSEDIWNVPSGIINYPRVGDFLVIGVYIYKPVNSNFYQQIPNNYVLLFGYIEMHHPEVNLVDNIIMDRSGAKIHFNHVWNDSINVIQEKDEKGNVVGTGPAYNGHLTEIGNRLVHLAGQKFLPFSLLSHRFTSDDPDIVFENNFKGATTDEGSTINSKKWSEIFTRNILDTNLINIDLTQNRIEFGETSKLLEPPCPPLNSKMWMHDSGAKELIYSNGNKVQFHRTAVEIIGSSYFPHSFAPDGKDTFGGDIGLGSDPDIPIIAHSDPTDSTPLGDGIDLKYHADGTSIVGEETNRRGSGLKEILLNGMVINIPDTVQTKISDLQTFLDNADEKAEPNKFKLIIGAITLIIDSAAGTITINASGGINMTGKLSVTGDIEASGDVKGVTGTFG